MSKSLISTNPFSLNRREFISNSARSAYALALFSREPQGGTLLAAKQFTVQEVIDVILKEGRLSPLPATVDTIKTGQGNQPVTGIVTTMFPTITVIRNAVKLKANFIIAHEPSFYNHSDDTHWVKNNTVLKHKQQLLEEHKMIIWRFHDYCHAMQPDMISYGVAKKANWLPYYKSGANILSIPSLSLQQLGQHLKSALGITRLRVIGNLQQPCSRIALLPGAWGGQRQVSAAETETPDVLIVGEVSEWETAEYMRDAQLLGRKTSLIILGHAVSEEPGMEWFADWLTPKLPGTKITHLPSGDPFTWL